MHCYEYLAMHLLLKEQMKRQFPERQFNVLEIEEMLCALNVTSLDELLSIQQQTKQKNRPSKFKMYSHVNTSLRRQAANSDCE